MKREKLKARRLSLGLTQQRVADEAEITRNYYTDVENGNRNCNLKTWLKIGTVLNIPEDQLISYMKEGIEG